MVLLRQARRLCAVASGGIALGIYTYMRPEKKQVQASCTANYHQPSYKWDYNWDKRDLSSLIKPAQNEDDVKEQNRINLEREKLKPTAYKHILLIRHGQYTKAEKPEDKKLTELGRKQAECVGQRLKELDLHYTKLTRSTMTRAMETSDIILQHLPDVPTESDDMLREGVPILPEPSPKSRDPDHVYFQDGARIEAAFRKYFHRADASKKMKHFYEIIVGHGNVILYFLCRSLQIPPEAGLNFNLDNCSITHIVITPNGEVIVCAVGDAGFIPADKKSYT